MSQSDLEAVMAFQMRALQLEPWETEYRFDRNRGWRFDFAWPARRIALEVEGGQWTKGAHTRGKGFEEDVEKMNAALLLGWKVYRATTNMVKDGRGVQIIERALKA